MTAALDTPEHPSPLRDRVSLWALLGALGAGPAAWSAQLIVSYGISSHACFPHRSPWLITPPPGWASEPAWLTAMNLVCLAIALGGAAVSWRHWRSVRGEKPGDAQSLLAIGEGRTRFITLCGILAGLGFSIAILFDTLEPYLIASCWKIAP